MHGSLENREVVAEDGQRIAARFFHPNGKAKGAALIVRAPAICAASRPTSSTGRGSIARR
jgi:hypothetical protein